MAQSLRFPVPAATAKNPHCTETTERRSRFLAQTCQADSREASLAFVDYIRSVHPDATHNCWAYVAGPPGDAAFVGSSDDGEPRGTAGRPMLNTLLHCGIGRICVVVSRWFGGIKLGTGGLCRAYQEAVAKNLESLPLECSVPRGCWKIDADYSSLAAIQRLLPDFEAVIEKGEYGESASLLVSAPLDKYAELKKGLLDLSNGRLSLLDAEKHG